MTVISYTNGDGPSTAGGIISPATGPARRKRLTGTAHHGPHWVNAIRTLRLVTQNAVEHAGRRRSATPDRVAIDIIDQIGELDPKALHVLAVTFSMLVRASQRRDQ